MRASGERDRPLTQFARLARARLVDGDRLDRAVRIAAVVGLVPFLAILWDLGWNPLRTAYADRLNSDFFDLQGRALLDGRLDVPAGSLGIEAFVRDGRHYMYFGPFPALLRLPILALTDRLDGRLTAPSMLLGWLVLAIALGRLVRSVREVLVGDAPPGRFEATLVGLVVATVLGGSSLLFLASQPWVYHEVYVWSAALSIVTVCCLLTAWRRPSARAAATATASATALILTRATTGWALALALVAAGAWQFARRRHGRRAGSALADLALACGGAFAAALGSIVNWAKFRHIVRFPIELHEWTRVSVHRQLVLLANEGRIDGPQFFWTDLVAYFRPDGIRVVPYFPFVTFPASPPTPVGRVALDETFRTGSVPAFMPLLLVATIWGLVVLARRGGRPGVGALRLAFGACVLSTAGVMAFGYVAPRYTAEFVPALAVGATVAAIDVGRRLGTASGVRGRRVRRTLAGAAAALGAFGMFANGATALANARRTARGDGLVAYVGWQERLSSLTGDPLADVIRRADTIPERGAADQLVVLGDCDALLLGTGETSSPWVVVQIRPRTFSLAVGDRPLPAGTATLLGFDGPIPRALVIESDGEGRIRLRVDGGLPATGDWINVAPGSTVAVRVDGDTARSRYRATAVTETATSAVEAPLAEWDRRLRSMPVATTAVRPLPATWRGTGASLEVAPAPRPALCDRLAGSIDGG